VESEENSDVILFPTRQSGAGTLGRRIALVLLIAGALVTLAAIPFLLRARESARKSACVNNLKQIWVALNSFADEHGQIYPRIDDARGNLIFDGGLVYPKYMKTTEILGCPSDSGYRPGATFRIHSDKASNRKSVPHPNAITCESYIYLGWVVTNEEEGLAAIDAYLELFNRKNEGKPEQNDKNEPVLILTNLSIISSPGRSGARPWEGPLCVSEGKGNLGSGIIHRLTQRSEIFAIPPELAHPEISYPSGVPVMWEWPTHHKPAGGHVLYLDGHVEFVEYPGRFPMTENFINNLRPLEPELPDAAPPLVNK
jgi:prepilin-type processing-associated H-X9-DG protein